METKEDKEANSPHSMRFVALIALAWAIIFAAYSSFLHLVFRSTSMDMALHSQILWNLEHGLFMQTSFLPNSFAGSHFWPAFYLLVPIHQWLGIHGLLAAQCLVVASGAFPAYLLSKDITKSEAWGRAFSVAYLLQPTLSIGVLFDYHLELFSVPFALFALLGLRRRRPWFFPCMLLSWCFYEINTAVFLLLGICLLFKSDYRKIGSLIALCSLAYLAFVVAAVMPHFRDGVSVPHWERYSHLGGTPSEAVAAAFLHPFHTFAESITLKKAWNLGYLLISFGLLPLLGLKYFLPAAPLLIVLMFSSWGINSDIRYGYVAPVLPFILLAAAHGAAATQVYGWLQKLRLASRGPHILVACSVLLFAYFHIKKPLRGHPFAIHSHLFELRLACDTIPALASLSADNHLGPRFAERSVLLVTPATKYNHQPVEFVFTDLNETEFKDSNWWASMQELIANNDYGPVFFSNNVLVMQRGVTNETLARSAMEQIATQKQRAQEKIRNKKSRGPR